MRTNGDRRQEETQGTLRNNRRRSKGNSQNRKRESKEGETRLLLCCPQKPERARLSLHVCLYMSGLEVWVAGGANTNRTVLLLHWLVSAALLSTSKIKILQHHKGG